VKSHTYRDLCAGDITAIMPGGTPAMGVSDEFDLSMLGPAGKVAEGVVADERQAEVRWSCACRPC
jgi:hypothetical protein